MARKGKPIPVALGEPSCLIEVQSSVEAGSAGDSRNVGGRHEGLLILNADDWGQDRNTTDRILDCVLLGAVSSVSAMVFMKDSERAAAIARERGIDAGLHLNFTARFSAPDCPRRLMDRQGELAMHFRRHHHISRIVFHPGLVRSFEYVVAAQREEFCRLYGAEPERLDGHHHVHLCSNVLLGGLLPPGTIVRRNFSFRPGEKSWYNRLYRQVVDHMLARSHRLTHFFFSLDPIDEPGRLQRIFALARVFTVEVATHPFNSEDYQFLTRGDIFRLAEDLPLSACFSVPGLRRTGRRG